MMPVYPSLTEVGLTIVRVIVSLLLGLGVGWGLTSGLYWLLKKCDPD